MDAAAILQGDPDEDSTAVRANDWKTCRDGECLPRAVMSHDESKDVSTEDDLRAGFRSFRMTRMAQRVTDYIRLVDQVVRRDRDLIAGTCVSHLIASGHRVFAPYRTWLTPRLARTAGARCLSPTRAGQQPLAFGAPCTAAKNACRAGARTASRNVP